MKGLEGTPFQMQEYIESLKEKIVWNEKKLQKVEKDIGKLVENVLNEKLR